MRVIGKDAHGWCATKPRPGKPERRAGVTEIRHRPALLALVSLVLVCAALAPACAAPSEYEIKAAFLYNFANFVEWPGKVAADSNGTLVIGVYGDDPFGDALDQTVAGKTINGRRIEIKRFRSVRDLKPCHILYISASEDGHTGRILDAIADWHVLTVGETDGFARGGGIIGFVVEDKKVKFEISTDNAKRAGIRVSSKLLKLAKVVR